MTNSEFWNSIQSIISSGFTAEGCLKLEEYAEEFIAGRILYKRFTPTEQLGCIAGGAINVIASILTGAEVGTDCLTAPVGSFKREQQCGAAQEAVIENWARKVDCWVEDTDASFPKMFGEHIAEGGEALVYDNGPTIIKVIGLDYFIQPILALDRVSLHNAYFGQTRLNVLGFGRSQAGDFKIIVEQPFIQGNKMTDSEISEYVRSLGYKLINPRNWTFANPQVYLSDMHDENVIKSFKGNVFVIDCDIRINTPELRAGGSRTLINEVAIVGANWLEAH